MTDHDKLREAIASLRNARIFMSGQEVCFLDPGVADLVANVVEATLPRTKMVEVWRVEWVTPGRVVHAEHYQFESNTRDRATCLNDEHCTCIHVTGPHQQEVPA